MKRIITNSILGNINSRRKYKRHSVWRIINININIEDINLKTSII